MTFQAFFKEKSNHAEPGMNVPADRFVPDLKRSPLSIDEIGISSLGSHRMRAIVICFLFSSTFLFGRQVLRYEPDKVTIEGTLELQTFPGPPNYESIKNGDRKETQWYLRLDHAINVDTNPNYTTGPWDPEKNVKIVQVIINDKDWKKVGKGKRIRSTGIVTHAITGHHHARVLLDIQTIKVLQ